MLMFFKSKAWSEYWSQTERLPFELFLLDREGMIFRR